MTGHCLNSPSPKSNPTTPACLYCFQHILYQRTPKPHAALLIPKALHPADRTARNNILKIYQSPNPESFSPVFSSDERHNPPLPVTNLQKLNLGYFLPQQLVSQKPQGPPSLPATPKARITEPNSWMGSAAVQPVSCQLQILQPLRVTRHTQQRA